MALSRRTAISVLGSAAMAAAQELASPPKRVVPESPNGAPKRGTRPIVCIYSGNFAKIPYSQLPDIVSGMGYDGVDLTVMKGGHVDPSVYMVNLDRAFQTFQDAGLDVPMVTTSFLSPSESYAYAIFYVSGQFGARFCRLGTWPNASESGAMGQNAAMRAMMIRNDLTQFAITGQRCNITPLLTNHAGSFPGRSIQEVESILNGVPAKAFGYCFDPAQVVMEAGSPDAWEPALQAALPRLAALSLSDIAPAKDSGQRLCALGEGTIDWKKFFSILAAAHFHGPISMPVAYEAANSVNAMKKDLAFVRARVEEAWPV
jgi:sugar phosphate isomerase/epimerase